MAPTLSRRQLLGLGGGAAAALALSGCGGSSSDTSEGSGGSNALTWSVWAGSSVEVAAWKHVAGLSEQSSGAKITTQTAAWGDYWTKLTSLAASGQTADIISMQSLRAPQFAELMVPLDDYLEAAGVNGSDFDAGIYDALKVDGKQMALPYDFGPLVVFYNKTAFDAAGLTTPSIGWTQDDFMNAAKALTAGNNYGFFAGSAIDSVIPWVMSQHGEQAVDADGNLVVDSAGWADTLNWYRNLIVTEKVAAQIPASGSQAAATNQFLAGNAAMNIDGPWSLINAKQTAKFEVGIAPMPVGASGSKSVSAGSGFGVSKSAKNPELAAKAAAGLVSVDAEAYLGEQGRAFPARTAQQESWYSGNDLASAKEIMDAAIASSEPFRTTPTWTQVNNTWQKYSVPAFNGDGSIEDLISQTVAQSGS